MPMWVYYCKNRLVVFHRKCGESLVVSETRDKELEEKASARSKF